MTGPAAPPPSPRDEAQTGPAGLIASRYRLGALIGRGASSEVHRAYDQVLRRTVAVKLLLPVELDDREAPAGSEDVAEPPPTDPRRGIASDASPGSGSRARDRFEREARAVARLRHHGIVRLHDAGVFEGRPYLVMELIEGQTLAQLVRAGAPRDICVRAVAEVAEAVAYAHGEGVLHRDLKPQNVLIDAAGGAKVVDFGLALDRSRETRITRTGELLGTPAYLAPEAARGQLPDERTDVYGLGACLYEVLTSRPPFTGNAAWQVLRGVLDDDPTPPRTIDPTVPWDLEAVCARALEKWPQHRYPTASSFAEELRRYLRGEPVHARRQTLPGRVRSFVRRHRDLLWFAGAAALFGLGLLAREPGLEVHRARRARAEEVLARAVHSANAAEEVHLIERALEHDGGYARAWLALGEAHLRVLREPSAAARGGSDADPLASALRAFGRAARQGRRPIAALAWSLRAQALEAYDREPKDVRACYQRSVRTRAKTPATLFARARLAALDGDHEAARELYDQVLKKDAYFAAAFAGRAEARLALGGREGALADAVRAVELDPQSIPARRARAAVRRAAGDASAAAADDAVVAELLGRARVADEADPSSAEAPPLTSAPPPPTVEGDSPVPGE